MQIPGEMLRYWEDDLQEMEVDCLRFPGNSHTTPALPDNWSSHSTMQVWQELTGLVNHAASPELVGSQEYYAGYTTKSLLVPA